MCRCVSLYLLNDTFVRIFAFKKTYDFNLFPFVLYLVNEHFVESLFSTNSTMHVCNAAVVTLSLIRLHFIIIITLKKYEK